MRSTAITKSSPIQWRNAAAMLGGGLYVASVAIWHPLHEGLFGGTALAVTHPLGHAIHHALELPAYLLLAVALLGLSRQLTHQLGWSGKLGLYLTLIGFALMSVGTLAIILFEGVLQTPISALETVHPLLLLPLIGALLCGPAILKAKVLALAGAWLIIIGAALFLGMIFTGLIDTTWGYWVGKGILTVFSAGWTWLGYAFWLETTRSSRPIVPMNQTVN